MVGKCLGRKKSAHNNYDTAWHMGTVVCVRRLGRASIWSGMVGNDGGACSSAGCCWGHVPPSVGAVRVGVLGVGCGRAANTLCGPFCDHDELERRGVCSTLPGVVCKYRGWITMEETE